MLITTEQMAAALRAVVDDVAQAVVSRVLAHKEKYGYYGLLPLHTLHSRVLQSQSAIIMALEADNHQLMLEQLYRLHQTRLRTGYDPASVLAIMEVIQEEILRAIIAHNTGNIYLCAALRTKLHSYLNSSRLQLARLNMLIAPDERNETDPDLGQILILPELTVSEPKIQS